MTDAEADLMAAIIAAPDDDAPRLVLADLLATRGDPHGELIVLQCQIAAGTAAELPRMQARADAMLAVGWKAYAGELAPYASQRAFERGFVARVRMRAAAFAKLGAQLLQCSPVRTVVLAPARGAKLKLGKPGALAKSPQASSVATLVLEELDPASVAGLGALLGVPALARLRHLSLSPPSWTSTEWPDAALAELERVVLGLPSTSTLRTVSLPNGNPGSPALRARFAVAASSE